jgi:sulfur carrier protein
MQVILNGTSSTTNAATLEALIAELKLERRTIAIELNRCVIPRSEYPNTALQEGDQIEVVHMIGGG